MFCSRTTARGREGVFHRGIQEGWGHNGKLFRLFTDYLSTFSIKSNQFVSQFQTLILKFKPIKKDAPSPSNNLPRQEDEEEDEPSTTPYIPAIIPGVTKIFNGLLTGNLNDIFHGPAAYNAHLYDSKSLTCPNFYLTYPVHIL
jgi:hypothetical protein